jgi:hypothetical protein
LERVSKPFKLYQSVKFIVSIEQYFCEREPIGQ